MNTTAFPSVFVLVFLGVLTGLTLPAAQAADPVDAVISRARAALGPERVLNAVDTLYYRGRIFNEAGEEEGLITLAFKKPYLQRVEVVEDGIESTSVVDDYEGYFMQTNMATGDQQIIMMSADRFRLMADTGLENLYFFRGPLQRRNGQIKLAGEQEINGVAVDVVEFIYPDGIVFTRYFDRLSGKLLRTHSTDGDYTLTEEGTFTAGGINFPRRILTEMDGKMVRTIEFFEIIVNKPMTAADFAFPAAKP